MNRIALLLCLLYLAGQAASAAEPPAHDRAFWRGIVAHDFAVPAGANAASLAQELAGQVASTDPEWRDEFGYEILARWIHRGVLTLPALEALRQFYLAGVPRQLGEAESDSVFGRSFSLLNLKELAAADLKTPYLSRAGFDELFDAAAKSLSTERDLRGFVDGKGWAHATAHAADLMRILARNAKLTRAQQVALIEVIVRRARSAGIVFTWGEESRLAAALATLLQREDAQTGALESWLAALQAEHRTLWQQPFDPAAYRRLRAQINLLSTLCATIAPLANPGLPAGLRASLYATLARLN